ncbi:hypothetical protein ACWIUD_11915 [Helicobacter sp. 23-1044]
MTKFVRDSAIYEKSNGLPRKCFAFSRNDGKLRQILRFARKCRICEIFATLPIRFA